MMPLYTILYNIIIVLYKIADAIDVGFIGGSRREKSRKEGNLPLCDKHKSRLTKKRREIRKKIKTQAKITEIHYSSLDNDKRRTRIVEACVNKIATCAKFTQHIHTHVHIHTLSHGHR